MAREIELEEKSWKISFGESLGDGFDVLWAPLSSGYPPAMESQAPGA